MMASLKQTASQKRFLRVKNCWRDAAEKPLLFQVGQIYGVKPIPRTIEELKSGMEKKESN